MMIMSSINFYEMHVTTCICASTIYDTGESRGLGDKISLRKVSRK